MFTKLKLLSKKKKGLKSIEAPVTNHKVGNRSMKSMTNRDKMNIPIVNKILVIL
jgi:hypothetical protein